MKIFAALVLPLALCAVPAFAQTPCGQRSVIVDVLTNQYGEAPIFTGIDGKGLVTEVFGAAENGTWTVIINGPNGRSCILSAGKTWRGLIFEKPTAGQDL